MKVKQIKQMKTALKCIQENESFNTGVIAYVANEDGTQGLMTKVVDMKVYMPINGQWVEV
jgi:GTP cyclohydrolase II